MDAKQHAEVMDALHTIGRTIGRNIAQQDDSRIRMATALHNIGTVLTTFGFVAVVMWFITLGTR